MGADKAWLVVNSRSGSNSEAACSALVENLTSHDMKPARVLQFPDDSPPTPEDLDAQGVRRLIVFTGDGSVNAIVESVSGWGGEVIVLPGGTMNLLSRRLHGENQTLEEILVGIASGAYRPVRPLMAECSAGRAYAGVLIGPGTAWAHVREAMRDLDVAGLARGTSEALAQTTGGPRVAMVEPPMGHQDGYPLIELTPSHRGLQVEAYRPTNAGELLQQSWAVVRRRFREAPHDRLGLHDRIVIANLSGEHMDVLLDGEPADLEPRAEFTVVECGVDLLATAHGF